MTEFDFTKADRKEAWLFLETVWHGLEYLCEQVEREEKERAKSLGLSEEATKNFGYTDFGSQPGDAMVCNYFLWYASALYNFIGVFHKAFSSSKDLEEQFVNVILWRNKVSAHTSWVWPHGDNAATQNMSILLYPEFNLQGDGHFEVGGARVFSETNGGSCADWRWGLVRTHERLKEIVSKYGKEKRGKGVSLACPVFSDSEEGII
jgi:hypothetical protein